MFNFMVFIVGKGGKKMQQLNHIQIQGEKNEHVHD